MNYFSHGLRYLDRPWFLAGTAVPDWLSVSDRPVRMRERRVAPFADGSDEPEAQLAAGILQHLRDDDWFHRTPAFHEVSSELTRQFRDLLQGEDGFRPSLLGHIVLEMVLDGVLIQRHPGALEEYYAAIAAIDPLRVQDQINRMAREPAMRLAEMIPLFLRERFLGDYLEPARLLVRLNQVQRRIKLSPLPSETITVLESAWELVERRAGDLWSPHPSPLDPPPEKDDA